LRSVIDLHLFRRAEVGLHNLETLVTVKTHIGGEALLLLREVDVELMSVLTAWLKLEVKTSR